MVDPMYCQCGVTRCDFPCGVFKSIALSIWDMMYLHGSLTDKSKPTSLSMSSVFCVQLQIDLIKVYSFFPLVILSSKPGFSGQKYIYCMILNEFTYL